MKYDVIEQPGLRTLTRELDSIGELTEFARWIDQAPASVRQGATSYRGGYQFTHTHSLAEAADLSEQGWPAGVERLEEAAQNVHFNTRLDFQATPVLRFDFSGEEVDMGRYLTNDPENMIDYNLTSMPSNNILELMVDFEQPHNITSEQIIGRGAAILAAYDVMQSKGFSVGVTMTGAQQSSNPEYRQQRSYSHDIQTQYTIPIQKPGESTDVSNLAFALLHPSFQRRLIFAMQDCELAETRDAMGFRTGLHYGTVADAFYLPDRPHPVVYLGREVGLREGPRAAQKILDMMIDAIIQD